MDKWVLDPVCEMMVDPKTAAAKAEYKGETYYFCAPGCKAAFEKDPEKYLDKTKQHEHAAHMGHGHCCH